MPPTTGPPCRRNCSPARCTGLAWTSRRNSMSMRGCCAARRRVRLDMASRTVQVRDGNQDLSLTVRRTGNRQRRSPTRMAGRPCPRRCAAASHSRRLPGNPGTIRHAASGSRGRRRIHRRRGRRELPIDRAASDADRKGHQPAAGRAWVRSWRPVGPICIVSMAWTCGSASASTNSSATGR